MLFTCRTCAAVFRGARRPSKTALYVVGALIALIAAGFGYLLWEDATERHNLRELKAKGRWTEGRVTAVTAERLGGETITIAYTVEGEEHEGKYQNGRPPSEVGDRKQVLYLPDSPSFNRLREPREQEWTFSWGRFIANRVLPVCLVVGLVAAYLGVKAVVKNATSSQ
jgi:hypothetical protein